MDAIGRESGVNKERVYPYFRSKAGFFAAVLDDQLAGLLDGLPVEGTGASAVGACAQDLFDRFDARPELARLLAWESLELPEPVAATHRAAACAAQVDGLRHALPGLDRAGAEQLLLSIVTLVTGWWTLAHVGTTILVEDRSGARRREELRRQAEAMAAAALADA
jgi:AcrR family transcriptional regulator